MIIDPDLLVGLDAPEQRISASPVRRVLALVAIYLLGLVLIWAAFQGAAGPVRMLLLVLFGAAFLYAADRMRRASKLEIVLDAEGLSDSSGAVLARWDQIEKVDRGAFSTKPTNGFSLLLHDKQPAGWAPGLWWRVGRRVGVGGILPGRPARFMGEQMAVFLQSIAATQAAAERERGESS